jgi:hypothetical protein
MEEINFDKTNVITAEEEERMNHRPDEDLTQEPEAPAK